VVSDRPAKSAQPALGELGDELPAN
jgi:hypothetical protein